MAFTFDLMYGHDMSLKDGKLATKWKATGVPAFGVDAFDFIASYALANVPATYGSPNGLLFLDDLQIHENVYAKSYEITAPYSPQGTMKKQPGAYQITFDQTGGTVHITAGRRIDGYGDADHAVNNGGLIGVDGDDISGTDIPVTQTKITVMFRHPQGVLNRSYIKRVGKLVGFPNNDSFVGYDPGEVLFKGGVFEETNTEATATYHFDISFNETNFTVGDVNGIDKKGWDILSPHIVDDVFDNGSKKIAVKKVKYGEIVRPREWKPYRSAFGWG